MKKMKIFSSLFLVALIFTGCISSNTNSSSSLIDFETLKDKELMGINDSTGTSFTFVSDGTLIIQKENERIEGTWEYDRSAKMYPYALNWNENGEKQGYIVDFFNMFGVTSVYGYWTVTDMNKTMTFEFEM